MEYFTTTSNASRRAVDCVIVGVYERGKLSAGARDVDEAGKGHLSDLIKSGDLPTGPGRCVVLTNVPGVRAKRVAVAGLGKPSKLDGTVFSKAVAAAIRALDGSKTRQILNTLTLEPVKDNSPYYLAVVVIWPLDRQTRRRGKSHARRRARRRDRRGRPTGQGPG